MATCEEINDGGDESSLRVALVVRGRMSVSNQTDQDQDEAKRKLKCVRHDTYSWRQTLIYTRFTLYLYEISYIVIILA